MSTSSSTPHKHSITPRIWLVVGLAVGLVVAALTLFIVGRETDPEASFQRGLAAITRRDVPALHREIQILRRFPKYEPQLQLLRGTVFLVGNDLKSALHQFDMCSVYPATRVSALTLAGETFCKMGRQRDAMGVLQQALSIEPKSIEAHRLLAVAYYDTGSNPIAVDELRKVVELDPKDSRPHRLMGLIHKDHEQFAEAVQDYRACLLLNPTPQTREEVLLELSQSLAKLHRYDEALKFLAQAQPTADTEACRAECEYSLGNKPRAREAALKAIALQPQHLAGLLWLGTLEAEASHLPQAAGYLERAVKAHPQDFSAPYKLAGVYQRMGRVDEAKEQMKRMEANRKLRERFTELHELANSRPDDAQVRYDLGQTASELKLFHLAKMWYEAALALNPQHAKAKQALAKLKIPDEEENAAAQLSSP